MAGYVSDTDFMDLLRVTELSLERGKLAPIDVPTLGAPPGRRISLRQSENEPRAGPAVWPI